MWAGASPVPRQMWAGVSPVPGQMWAAVCDVPAQMWVGGASPLPPAGSAGRLGAAVARTADRDELGHERQAVPREARLGLLVPRPARGGRSMHRIWRAHICAGTNRALAGSHLRRGRAHPRPRHAGTNCAHWTGFIPAHICAGTGLTPAHICAGTGLVPATYMCIYIHLYMYIYVGIYTDIHLCV
jgi:hypothetical protein